LLSDGKPNYSTAKRLKYMGFFSRKEKHVCPDGTVRYTHRNADAAFPLYIANTDKKSSGELKGLKGISTKISKEDKTKIQETLYALDDFNNTLMLKFRSAYVLFETNPCAGYQTFSDEILKINSDHQKMLVLKTKISLYVGMSGNLPFEVLSNGILKLMEDYNVAEYSSTAIHENRDLMKKLKNQNDEG
jgi:hypothetical protein